jgi:hypothetical protein
LIFKRLSLWSPHLPSGEREAFSQNPVIFIVAVYLTSDCQGCSLVADVVMFAAHALELLRRIVISSEPFFLHTEE